MQKTKRMAKASAFAQFSKKFDALAMREKHIIFIAAPALVLFVVALLFIEPMYLEIKTATARTASQQSQLTNLQNTSSVLMTEMLSDPDDALNNQITSLTKQVDHINASFERELSYLVLPTAMPALLQNLFEQAKGLELLKMESMAPSPIFANNNQNQITQLDNVQLYRQGIRLTFQGDYFATRDFFAQAENMPWQLYWKSLNYNVHSHPLAITQLEVFTLSTSEAFIGVN